MLARILRKVLTVEIYSRTVNMEKISICLNSVKTENPEGTAQVDFVTFIVQSYFNTLLRYAVTFCGAVVLKVMDQKTSLSAGKVIRCV